MLRTVKLIAEPWDCGPGGYQVGGFPPGWAEWNDKFRDTVRDFWRGDAPASALAPRLCASGDLFDHRGRKPWACVNFVTAHDGFTLQRPRLLQRQAQRGERRGQPRRQLRQPVVELRRRRPDRRSRDRRAARPPDAQHPRPRCCCRKARRCCSPATSSARTQNGNNNAYCQDNEISWVNWDIEEKGQSLIGFVQKLTALRHKYPILRRSRFLTGDYNEELGVKDVTWINAVRRRDEARGMGRHEHANVSAC